jgi:hypothetical protein
MSAVIGALRVNLGLNSAEFEEGMKKVSGSLAGVGKAFAALGGMALFAGFNMQIGAAAGRIEETRKLTAQLDKAIANTGNTARTSGKEIADYADKLERSTGRAAEEVLAVGTNLATFGFSRKVFFDAIDLANDMSAAWGGDLKQNVEGLARALADPEKGLAMLTKRGITFTDEQKKMIAGFMKSNDLIGAQGVVMSALNEQVKGVAEAGFSGLTKAKANATLAMEEFFETIANAMGVNTGLEMSLTAVAAALDFVSQNFDVLARGAGVAGVALGVALGPAVWATISGAATLMSNVVVAGLSAIRVALLLNPMGLLAVGLVAAVTAAVLFRDEMKQIIGVDFVGEVNKAVNQTIGFFVGGYDAVKQAWSNLPHFFSAVGKQAWNALLDGMSGDAVSWTNPFTKEVVPLLSFDFTAAQTKLSADEAAALKKASATFDPAFNRDYLGDLGKSLGGVGSEASVAATKIAGLSGALEETGLGGAAKTASEAMKKLAAEGKAVFESTRTDAEKYAAEIERLRVLLQAGAIDQDTFNRAVLQAQEAFTTVGQLGKQVTSSLQSGFADVFKGLVSGSTNAMDAVSKLLGKLGDLFIDQAFNMLFSGGGVGGGLGGLFSGIGKLFGFARGGTIMPGGAGGIDSQLVAFRKSPNERVDITKPGQTLSSGGFGHIHITSDDARFRASMRNEAGQVVAESAPALVSASVSQANKSAPGAIAQYQNNVAGGDYRLV